MSQREHRTDRTAETRSAPARGQSPAERAELLEVQRTLGNAAALHLLRRAQEKPPEQTAQPAVQRSAVHDVLSGSGRPLAASLRAEMESRLGADFSDVRVHDDAAARASAAGVGARAYTSGHHVVIGEGGADKHTLAHELTHVIQQRQGPVSGSDNGSGLRVSDPSDRFERDAEANAHRVMRGAAPAAHEGHAHGGAGHAGGAAVQRFMAPTASGDTAAWRQEALQYFQSAEARNILRNYAELVLGEPLQNKLLAKLVADLGIKAEWRTVVQATGGAAGPAGANLDASLTAVLRNLNIMEQEVLTSRKVGEPSDYDKPLPQAVVGTEFTFTDDTLNGITGGNPLRVDISGLTGQADARARSAITYARNKMNDWAGRVQAADLPAGFELAVSNTEVKGQEARKFTYTKGDAKWWWEITMDDACLETRSDPTPITDLHAAHVRYIVERHVFQLAEDCGLRVDQSIFGGGGHISLDSGTTFGGSVELFVESMRQWEDDWNSWVGRFGAAPRAKDTVNAPWTGDLPQGQAHLAAVKTLLDEILADARRGDVDLPGAVRRLQAHMMTLPLHQDATPNLREKVDAHPEDRLHYQAVNLEHMNDANARHQRVEFRDIQAQASYEELLDDLRHIGFLLQGVRGDVGPEQAGRLAARHQR
ncbi:eCIS core domain-containing protein [Streptomyces sp. NPDC001665]